MSKNIFTSQTIQKIKTKKQLVKHLEEKGIKYDKVKYKVSYAEQLELLQVELLKLQRWVRTHKQRVVIIFEGRDAAGKGGAIRRFKRYLNPRSARVVALNKPTEVERGQWYFRRHVKELPNEGEIVFFDRSWYNRAVVEPVMGFCTTDEYHQFIRQVPDFEHMLYEDGVKLIKFWFSITKEEQSNRFTSRQTNPLKQWKISTVDLTSQQVWDKYTHYIEEMMIRTHSNFSPWILVSTDDKRQARLESIRYVLSQFDYKDKDDSQTTLYPDPSVIQRFSRSMISKDLYPE